MLAFILLVLALALFAYTLTGGADFGVGIIEAFAPASEKTKIRALSEKAIAPIWEANHIWIILALVILFVVYPSIHVALMTNLHAPIVLVLAGIIIRGTAFTFRYYDIEDDPISLKLWSGCFQLGSVMVPFFFGHIAAAAHRGQLLPTPTTVWMSYWAPWIGWFPAATGLFTVGLFAWIASVFLGAEVEPESRIYWHRLSQRWAGVMVITGFLGGVAAYIEQTPWTSQLLNRPLSGLILIPATFAVGWVSWSGSIDRVWLRRIMAGVVVGCVLAGYFGVTFPSAVVFADKTSLNWLSAAAPLSTQRAMVMALVMGSSVIFPGLYVLFRLFKVKPSSV